MRLKSTQVTALESTPSAAGPLWQSRWDRGTYEQARKRLGLPTKDVSRDLGNPLLSRSPRTASPSRPTLPRTGLRICLPLIHRIFVIRNTKFRRGNLLVPMLYGS